MVADLIKIDAPPRLEGGLCFSKWYNALFIRHSIQFLILYNGVYRYLIRKMNSLKDT